ncbi:hypothetical protein [Paenibacillus tengchongensis]|uniref:hypothetical protein n=1 Tax=Paenibacillus tengchongensis TaxID=2608684 RepID=UPI00124EEEB5|nr:hypothetical protein [Paenibacillus tengchongensis]
MSKIVVKNVNMNDLKALEEPSEAEYEKYFKVVLYRGGYPGFQFETYAVNFLSTMAGNYSNCFLLHELDKMQGATLYNKAYTHLLASSHVTKKILDDMIKKAIEMKLNEEFLQVESLVPLLGNLGDLSDSDSDRHHQIFEDHILDTLEYAREKAPTHSENSAKFKEYGFLILDKSNSIKKYGAITVAATKSLLMDLLIDSHDDTELSKNQIDVELNTIINKWINTGKCKSSAKGRNQELISNIEDSKNQKMYVIVCPKVAEVMEKSGFLSKGSDNA